MSKKRSKTPSTSHKTTRKTEAPKVLSRPSVEVSVEAIARLAFAKFVERGYVHGHHVQDWLAAEAELLAR